MELQPNTDSTDRHKILSNTPNSKKETKHEPSSTALRQNWFKSSFTHKFTTNSTEPVKLEKQEGTLEPQPQISQTQTLAKRIRNAIRLKALAVSPGFVTAGEAPVLKLDSIARPLPTQDDTWEETDRRCVCKQFGARAEKYVIFADESTKIGEKDLESGSVDNGIAVDDKSAELTGEEIE